MNIADFITRVVDNGHSIIAVKGVHRREFSKVYLTKCWLTMSNDDFYDRFGFNWVPPTHLQDMVRKGGGS